jgi:hypothetical protein
MGFFSGHRLVPIYLHHLKSYGINPSLIPASVHVAICDDSELESAEEADSLIQMGGHLNKKEHIQGGMSVTAEFVALLTLGPMIFDASGKHHFANSSEMIENLARDWLANGMRGTHELRVLNYINDAGFLSEVFADCLRTEVARQQQDSEPSVTQKRKEMPEPTQKLEDDGERKRTKQREMMQAILAEREKEKAQAELADPGEGGLMWELNDTQQRIANLGSAEREEIARVKREFALTLANLPDNRVDESFASVKSAYEEARSRQVASWSTIVDDAQRSAEIQSWSLKNKAWLFAARQWELERDLQLARRKNV